jgi:hypothetical protein
MIDQANQVCKLLLGNQPWAGPDDLSAKIYAMYDDNYLYVGAEVKDNVVVTTWDFPVMSYPWDTDCMEVILDTRRGSDQGTDPPTPGLFRHLSMAEYRRTEFGPEKWQGGGAGGPHAAEAFARSQCGNILPSHGNRLHSDLPLSAHEPQCDDRAAGI